MIWNTSRDSSHRRQEGRDPEVNAKVSAAHVVRHVSMFLEEPGAVRERRAGRQLQET
jgi:hypothetical protein